MNTSTCFFMFVSLILAGRFLTKEDFLGQFTDDKKEEKSSYIAETKKENRS